MGKMNEFSWTNNGQELVAWFKEMHCAGGWERLAGNGVQKSSTDRVKKNLHLNVFSFSPGF